MQEFLTQHLATSVNSMLATAQVNTNVGDDDALEQSAVVLKLDRLTNVAKSFCWRKAKK